MKTRSVQPVLPILLVWFVCVIGHLCACVVQKMKHSKLAEGIEQSYVHNPQLLPAGIDADSVSSQSTSL